MKWHSSIYAGSYLRFFLFRWLLFVCVSKYRTLLHFIDEIRYSVHVLFKNMFALLSKSFTSSFHALIYIIYKNGKKDIEVFEKARKKLKVKWKKTKSNGNTLTMDEIKNASVSKEFIFQHKKVRRKKNR